MVPSVGRINHEKGQGLVEYALLIAMLALVILVPTMFLGPIIGNVFSKIGNPLYAENLGQTTAATPAATPTPTWTTCAVENGTCSFSGTALVRYGADPYWHTGTYTNGVACNNNVFGDPDSGIVKSCQILGTPATATPTPVGPWTTCAAEGGTCSFSGTALVRYGADPYWVGGTYTNGVACNNNVFGDPDQGIVKSCQINR